MPTTAQQSPPSSKFGRIEGTGSALNGPGVHPYWTGEGAKDDAFGYAKARAKFGRGEIRVLKQDGSLEYIIGINVHQKSSWLIFQLVGVMPDFPNPLD